jgi:hypothetical protein
MRQALRLALGTRPNPALLAKTLEPHDRGAILVAAVFDAYFSVYIQQTRPLMRVARAGGGNGGDLHPELVTMLADRAAKTAERFLTICIRALDYCPPVDLQFGEFLRAIVTADMILVPEDPAGYRTEIIKAFRRRGIVPAGVKSYSEEALRWCGPADRGRPLQPIVGLDFDVLRETIDQDSTEAEQAMRHNAERATRNAVILHTYATAHAKDLGLDPARPIQPFSFHPVYRIGPGGRLMVQFIVEFLQKQEERFDPSNLASAKFTHRGGSTVIFDHRGRVQYVIEKPLGNSERVAQQRAYLANNSAAAAFTSPTGSGPSFAAIHRGC